MAAASGESGQIVSGPAAVAAAAADAGGTFHRFPTLSRRADLLFSVLSCCGAGESAADFDRKTRLPSKPKIRSVEPTAEKSEGCRVFASKRFGTKASGKIVNFWRNPLEIRERAAGLERSGSGEPPRASPRSSLATVNKILSLFWGFARPKKQQQYPLATHAKNNLELESKSNLLAESESELSAAVDGRGAPFETIRFAKSGPLLSNSPEADGHH